MTLSAILPSPNYMQWWAALLHGPSTKGVPGWLLQRDFYNTCPAYPSTHLLPQGIGLK